MSQLDQAPRAAAHPAAARAAAHPAYYPAIDSLRAVAVVSVVLFHLKTGLLASGFVGVDVFFVISGFVVSLSMASVRLDRFGAYTAFFYARRLLRIAPALLVFLLVTSLVSILFVPRAWLSAANMQTAQAAFFGLSNFVLAGPANGYFSPRSEFNPFTHTWSLAVEEQFYFVFPVLMFFWTRASATERSRRRVAWTLAVFSALSLACCAGLMLVYPKLAFYLLPPRFWELGLGMAVFLSRSRWQPWLAALPAARARWIGWGLLAGLAVSLEIVSPDAFPFPGAVLPVLCTAGLLALIVGRDDAVLPNFMRETPLVWIGKISYSLYLWHWPVIVLMRWTVGIESASSKLLALAVSLVLAVLSYRFVERPLREAPAVRAAPRWAVVSGALATVVVAAGLATVVFKEEPRLSLSTVTRHPGIWLPDAAVPPLRPVASCELEYAWQALAGGAVLSFKPRACPDAIAKPAGRLFVAGDSHAQAYSAMLQLYAKQSGQEVRLMTMGGCSLFNLQVPTTEEIAPCQAFTAAAMRELQGKLEPGDTLFLPSLRVPRFRDQWGDVAARPTPEQQTASRRAAVVEASGFLQRLAGKEIGIVIEAPKPIFKAPPFRCADWFNRHNPICEPGFTITRQEMDQVRAPALAAIGEVSSQLQRVSLWDPLPTLCPTATCSAFKDGQPMYIDGDHLSGFGNATLVDAFEAHMRSVHGASARAVAVAR